MQQKRRIYARVDANKGRCVWHLSIPGAIRCNAKRQLGRMMCAKHYHLLMDSSFVGGYTRRLKRDAN